MFEESFDKLREMLKSRMSEKRYTHTLGVESMAVKLGNIFLPGRVGELRVAALLHDVAKELSKEEQVLLIKEYGVKASDEDLMTVPALHSFAAVAVIQRDFADYAAHDVLSAVENHTLGDPGMSLFDKVIYISDYIEEGRTHESCAKVREQLMSELQVAESDFGRVRALNRAIIASIDFTIQNLLSRGCNVNSRTLITKNALLALN